jgi:hypothetical protein
MGPPFVGITADTEEHGLKVWRPLIHHLQNTELSALLADYSREYMRVELLSGAVVQLFSAHNPAALSGEGVSVWVVDEAQFFTQEAYENMLPSVADRHGIIVMAGTAEGEGPFREVCYKGHNADFPEYFAMQMPSLANPYIDPYEIEILKRGQHPTKAKQLYDAEWVTELGKVFTNVKGCIDAVQIIQHAKGWGYILPYLPGRRYYGGLDLGRKQDFTVYTIWDAYGRMIAFDRYNAISWDTLLNRCAEFSRAYGDPLTCLDSTGIGDYPFEELIRRGMSVVDYHISGNVKKRELIDKLAVRIAQGQLRYPRWDRAITELERMEAKTTRGSALVRYEAPGGEHDDIVLSMALAQQVLPEPATVPAHTPHPDPYRELAEIMSRSETQKSAADYITGPGDIYVPVGYNGASLGWRP